MSSGLKTHKGISFSTSMEFWEKAYRAGNRSGSGSYGKLADFKADYINRFIADHTIETVVDMGCGDENQLSLGDYRDYVGLDVSSTLIVRLSEQYRDDPSKRFIVYEPFAFDARTAGIVGELALSLDVIFHLIEDDVFNRYIQDLFALSIRYVLIYSKDLGFPRGRDEGLSPLLQGFEEPCTPPAAHVKQRNIAKYILEYVTGWELVAIDRNIWPVESPSDFFVYRRTGPGPA